MPKLCLIDGSGFIFRAFHAFPPLSTPNGDPVNAIYGFTKALLAIKQKKDFDYIAVVFDSGRKTFRNDIYPDYKAHRPEIPSELLQQLPFMAEVVESLSIASLKKNLVEADDIIATYTKVAKSKGISVEIVSSDKDLMQLVDDASDIYLYDDFKKKIIKEQQVEEKFFVKPTLVPYIQSLMGDASDNVPGVKGVGLKTASMLVQSFGSLDNIYANLANIQKTSLVQKLEEHRDLAFLSLDLVRLREDLVLEHNLDDLKDHPIDVEKCIKFLAKMSFRSLVGQVSKKAANSLNQDSNNDLTIHGDKLDISGSSSALKDCKDVFFDNTYSSSDIKKIFRSLKDNYIVPILLNQHQQGTWHLSIYDSLLHTNYHFEGSHEIPTIHGIESSVISDYLGSIFADSAILKVFFDIKQFWHLFPKLYELIASFADIKLMDYLLYGVIESEDPLRWSLERSGIKDSLPKHLYASSLWDLYTQYNSLIVSYKCKNIYERIDKKVLSVLYKMEIRGILIDTSVLTILRSDFQKQIQQIQQAVYDITDMSFNIASPKQLGSILFEKLGLKGKRRKNGNWKTDIGELERLSAEGHEIADLLIEWRQLTKLQNTYIEKFISLTKRNKRLHTRFLPSSTTTGRISSVDPNLQQIPIRSDNGKKIRRAFVSQKGYKLLSLDYSQMELRILAHYAQVLGLQQAFDNNEDIHKKTASDIFHIPLDSVNEDLRRKAKAINFGIIYGQMAFGLANSLKISNNEAQAYIDSYFTAYSEIKKYMNDIAQYAKKYGYVKTILGRKCFIPNMNSSNHNVRSFAMRSAINAPIQGTAADIIRLALISIDKYFAEEKVDAFILLQIHDEILIEVNENVANNVAEIVSKLMEVVLRPVSLVVNYKIADSWYEAH